MSRDTKTAFETRLPDLLGLAESEVARVHTKVAVAAELVLTAADHLGPLSDKIKRMYETDVDLVAELKTTALAAWHADALANDAQDVLPELGEQGYALRAELMPWARLLAKRGHLSATTVGLVQMKRGYRNVAMDLLRLVQAFEERWTDVEGVTPWTKADIERAHRLSKQLLAGIVTRRGGGSDKTLTPIGLRNRAFTKMRDEYRRIRHAVAFIVGVDGDPNALTPPLSRVHLYRPRLAKAASTPVPATTSTSTSSNHQRHQVEHRHLGHRRVSGAEAFDRLAATGVDVQPGPIDVVPAGQVLASGHPRQRLGQAGDHDLPAVGVTGQHETTALGRDLVGGGREVAEDQRAGRIDALQ